MTRKITSTIRQTSGSVAHGNDAVIAIRMATRGLGTPSDIRYYTSEAVSEARKAFRESVPSWARALDLTLPLGEPCIALNYGRPCPLIHRHIGAGQGS